MATFFERLKEIKDVSYDTRIVPHIHLKAYSEDTAIAINQLQDLYGHIVSDTTGK